MEKQDILKGLQEEGIMGFLSNNYWKLDKEELKQIGMEIDYATDSSVSKSEYKRISEKAIEALKEQWIEEY